MRLDDFCRVFEEIGLAAWHGDGRTTTVKEIKDHCEASGLTKLLSIFQEGAEAGVTRLLAAFFFRRYGERTSGDPTFVFTHKSFGEYLASRRMVRAIDRVNRELKKGEESPDEGWDERDALKHWAQICGPSAMSHYLHAFVLNELTLRPSEQLAEWKNKLTGLFNYMLCHGMPMEQLQISTFKEALFQSGNAEEALLAAMNGCACLTKQLTAINVKPVAFMEWFCRMRGQGISVGAGVAAKCLSFLDLRSEFLEGASFWNADFHGSKLDNCWAILTGFYGANLNGASLEDSVLMLSTLAATNLTEANLKKADLTGANLTEANLTGANLTGADLRRANLEGANLEGIKGKWLGVPHGAPASRVATEYSALGLSNSQRGQDSAA